MLPIAPPKDGDMELTKRRVGERLRPEPVAAMLSIYPRCHKVRFPQHAQVLRDGRLAECKTQHQLANAQLPLTQFVKDATAIRLGKDSEGRPHGDSMPM